MTTGSDRFPGVLREMRVGRVVKEGSRGGKEENLEIRCLTEGRDFRFKKERKKKEKMKEQEEMS